MKAEQRAAYIENLLDSCLGLLANKGAEYSRGEEDVNSNFKRVAEAVGSDPIKIAFVYFLKHMDSIANFVKTRETPSGEPIEGRIHDAINYLAILGSLIQEERDEGRVKDGPVDGERPMPEGPPGVDGGGRPGVFQSSEEVRPVYKHATGEDW